MFISLENFGILNLCKLLNLLSDSLHRFAAQAPKLYYERKIIKHNKTRIIEIPNYYLKQKQKIIQKKILYNLPTHPRLYGYPGTSIKKAVYDHVRKPVVITMDIMNFFPSVRASQIRAMFRRRKASEDVAEILTRLITYKNHLAHGSPTSPCIGRLILNPLAKKLEKMINEIHPKTIFSIYVDDIIISGPLGIKRAIPTIYKMINRYGFEINTEKTKVMMHYEDQESLNIRLNKRIEPTTKFLEEVEKLSKRVNSSDLRLKGKKAFINFLFKKEH